MAACFGGKVKWSSTEIGGLFVVVYGYIKAVSETIDEDIYI